VSTAWLSFAGCGVKSMESSFVGVEREIAESVGDCADVVSSFVAFATGSRDIVEWGTSGRLDNVVGIGPMLNCKAL
jgi:hypothetical protein